MNQVLPFVVVIIILIIALTVLVTILLTKKNIESSDRAIDELEFRKEVNLINEKIIEMNDYYNFIKEEMEKKHKELLFLYKMMNLKEAEIKKLQSDENTTKKIVINEYAEEESSVKEIENINQKVLKYSKEGLSASEIAKKMGKGKGEVELIIKLYG